MHCLAGESLAEWDDFLRSGFIDDAVVAVSYQFQLDSLPLGIELLDVDDPVCFDRV